MTYILTVDGDRHQGPILARMLNRYGSHSVVHETCLSRVDQYFGTYQLAVLAVDDLDGEVRGIPALRELRAKIRSGVRPQTPILTIFDHASNDHERMEALMGGDAFMERPVLRDNLLDTVERLARQHGCYGHTSAVIAAAQSGKSYPRSSV
jgi:DNA-binding response OmpR family regulator